MVELAVTKRCPTWRVEPERAKRALFDLLSGEERVVPVEDAGCYGGVFMAERGSPRSTVGTHVSETQLASTPVADRASDREADRERLGPLPDGEVLGHYRVLEHIDSGGMGHIHRALDMRLERAVAIKVTAGRLGGEAARTLKEARALAALNHVNVVTVYELGVHDDRPYIVMELLRGESLRARIDRSPPSLAEALRWSCDVLRGMSAAHAASIVHLDLKPENLFLTSDGTLKILDFGVARLVGADHGAERAVAGTIAYMAPEQLGREAVDFRADLFAFGVILHELATGKHPFKGKSGQETAAALAEDRHGAIGEFPDAEIEAIVRACLAHDPTARPESADKLLERLEHVRSERAFDGERGDLEYAETDDGHIAFQCTGKPAGLDLVVVPGLLSRFEVWTQEPEGASFLRALSKARRVIVFDRCGLGASDRLSDVSLPTLDDEVAHLRAVLDAARSSRAILLAMGEGAPLALLTAAVSPERVAGVVVIGGAATYADPAAALRLGARARQWGTSAAIETASSRERRLAQWLATWERMTASPRTMRAWASACQKIDVRPLLPFVTTPALVLRGEGDADCSSEECRALARALPRATYEEIQAMGLPWAGTSDAAARIDAFVREAERAEPRVAGALATWCVTDLEPRELPPTLRSSVVPSPSSSESLTLLRLDRAALAVRALRAALTRRGVSPGRSVVVSARRDATAEHVVEEALVQLAAAPAGSIAAAPLARAIVEGTSAIRLGPSSRPEESGEASIREPLEEIAPLAHRTFSVQVDPGPRLRIQGQMMLRDPERLLLPHFRRIHERAAGRDRLELDVRRLAQINSSNLGIFIQWVGWIRAEPEERRYELVIIADKSVAWQRTNLVPLEMIAPEVLHVVTEAS